MKNAIRAVMCVLCMVISATISYNLLVMRAYAAIDEKEYYDDYSLDPKAITFAFDSVQTNVVNYTNVVGSSNRVATIQQIVRVSDEQEVVSQSIKQKSAEVNNFVPVIAPADVDAERLMNAYNSMYEPQDWDVKGKMDIIQTLWDFLVVQNNVDEVNAAAIIGTTMYEGRFAQEESTYKILSGIEEARELLGSGECGYGVAQWTWYTRQNKLLNYYELANELYPDDWERAYVVAECCMLLSEIQSYGVFDNLYDHTTIEDAVGRMCLSYELYDGVYEQWSSEDGYHLTSQNCSGSDRVEYAKQIYNYLWEDNDD